MIETDFLSANEGDLVIIGTRVYTFGHFVKLFVNEVSKQTRLMIFQMYGDEARFNAIVFSNFNANIYKAIEERLNEFDVLLIDHLSMNATYNLNEVLSKIKNNPKFKTKIIVIGVTQRHEDVPPEKTLDINGFGAFKDTILSVANQIYFWNGQDIGSSSFTLTNHSTNKIVQKTI